MANKQLNAVLIFGGDASKALSAVNSLNDTVNKLNTTVKGMAKANKTAATSSASSWSGFMNVIKTLGMGVRGLVDGFRLMTQGMMSAGRAMTFFVTIPLLGFLRQASTNVMGFQDGLIRVGKTTEISGKQLDDLGQAIRDISLSAPTATADLLAMAEQAGQLGVRDPKGIVEFIRWMEIMATSTNISGDEVVNTMGKISAAFGWNINESVDQVARLANVMNILENRTAATAGEIADALFRFAPVANQLGIHAADAAALSAALISLGVSADSAGTRLGTMYIKMTQNADKFAVLASNTEQYATEQDVLNAINEDAVSVLGDLIAMMEAEDNRAKALAESFELVGIRGGRALGALASGESTLKDAIKEARMEWEEAGSLIEEYNRQLESASSQMQILKNNVNDVGLSFANSLLPAVNNAIQLLIPGIRKLSDYFKQLDDRTKLIIVAALAFAVALGPVLFMVSQVTFGFSMFLLGIMKAAQGIFWTIKGLSLLGSALAAANGWVILLVAAVVGGFILLLKVISNAGVDIADYFRQLGNKAKAWGENLAANIANGFVAGAIRYIVAAIQWVANLIASFFEGHSPPKVGPLSHIDEWGKTLIDTFFSGMMKADFDILKRVSNVIQNIFKNLSLSKLMGEKAQFKNLLQARQDLAKLLSIFRDTGKIAEDVLNDVVKNLGEAADEVKTLIKLELEYMKINEELAKLEERRAQTQENFADTIDDIASGGGSPAERVKAIRQAAKERDKELKKIADEEKELEKQKNQIEEQLELQRAMIEAMQEQDDIQARLIDSIKALSGAIGDIGGGFPEIEAGGMFGDVPDVQEMLDELGTPIIEFEAKIKSKEGIWDAFLAGIRGEKIGGDLQELFGVADEDVALLAKAYDWGLQINSAFTTVKGTWETIKGIWDSAVNTLTGFSTEGIEVPAGVAEAWAFLGSVWEGVKSTWEEFQPLIQSMGEIFGKNFEAIKEAITGTLQPAFDSLSEAWARISGEGGALQPILETLGQYFGFIATGIGEIVKIWAKVSLTAGFALLIGIINVVVGLVTSFIETIMWLAEQWTVMVEVLGNSSTSLKEKIVAIFTFMFQAIIGWVIHFVETIIQYFINLFQALVGGSIIPDMLNAMLSWFTTMLTQILTWVMGWIQMLIGAWAAIWGALQAAAGAVWSAILGVISTALSGISNAILSALNRIKTIFTVVWNAAKVIVVSVWNLIKSTIMGIATAIASFLVAKFNAIKSNITGTWNQVKAYFNMIWSAIKVIFTSVLNAIVSTVQSAMQNVVAKVKGIGGQLKAAGASVMESLLDGIKSMANRIMDYVSDLAKKIIKKLKDALDFHSPSKIFIEMGENVSLSLAMGIKAGMDDISFVGGTNRLALLDALARQNYPAVTYGGVPFAAPESAVKTINININDPVVRDDDDINTIVEEVKKAIEEDTSLGYRYLGA